MFVILFCASVYWWLVVTFWERTGLLALVCDVQLWVCYFPIGILGRCGTWLYRFLIFALFLTYVKQPVLALVRCSIANAPSFDLQYLLMAKSSLYEYALLNGQADQNPTLQKHNTTSNKKTRGKPQFNESICTKLYIHVLLIKHLACKKWEWPGIVTIIDCRLTPALRGWDTEQPNQK